MPGLITTQSDDVQILDFEETRILDQEVVDTLGAELQAVAQSTDSRKIIVDMNRIELMTSTMIGQFVTFNKACTERGIAVQFCNLTSQIRELLKITKLEEVFSIAKNRENAMTSFHG